MHLKRTILTVDEANNTRIAMATTIDTAFEAFAAVLTPSSSETTAAASHRESVYNKLNAAFGVSSFFRTGSTGNSTGVRFHSDVDYFASIPVLNQRSDSAYMLQKVKDALQERFPFTDIHISTPAVVCNFGSDSAERIEVVPAYYVNQSNSSNVYKIPVVGGGWTESSPTIHNAYVSSINDNLNKKVKPLVRFIKAIKY